MLKADVRPTATTARPRRSMLSAILVALALLPAGGAQAITGGAVYRGAAIPELDGFYIYGDFLSQRFFAFNTKIANAPNPRESSSRERPP